MAALWAWVAGVFERGGIIDADRLSETVSLAWPRTVTGFAIMSKRAVDLAVVGLAVGPTAVAGLAFAGAYWQVAKFLGIGLAGGTVGLVSQNYGGDESARAATVVKVGLWIALAISVPTVVAFVVFAEPLIGVLGSDPDAVRAGAVYLALVAPGILFEYLNLLASRTYAGVGDTFTPMVVRAGGAVLNVALSAGLVLGAGWGVAGAAVGTATATGVVTVLLGWGMLGRDYPGAGMAPSPVTLLEGQSFDRELAGQLLRVSAPLMARRTAEGLVVFPLLWIASAFGPLVVAGLEVGRRVRALVNSFSWGFGIASSTLVGQRLGAGEEREAEAVGDAIIRLSAVVYVVAVVVVLIAARPISTLFVSGTAEVAEATRFVRAAAVSTLALGIDGSATGVLRGAGDTRWPFVASLLGRYAVALPVAALGLAVEPLAVVGLYVALVAETAVPGVVNLWRVRTNAWKAVSRAYRPS